MNASKSLKTTYTVTSQKLHTHKYAMLGAMYRSDLKSGMEVGNMSILLNDVMKDRGYVEDKVMQSISKDKAPESTREHHKAPESTIEHHKAPESTREHHIAPSPFALPNIQYQRLANGTSLLPLVFGLWSPVFSLLSLMSSLQFPFLGLRSSVSKPQTSTPTSTKETQNKEEEEENS
ncbi:hypothetical protein BZA77DRAFT_295983 [Pyronema omphalodes]|nr:hypothetical protein BZA77DRAFT_295983 [Pyronema omphalodes]